MTRPLRTLLLGLALAPACALAASVDFEVRVIITDHRFVPPEVEVPAGRKIRLVVDNQDATAEEFESYELNREKVVPGKSAATIFLGPLKPGRYPFFGEFHEATARGAVVAR